MAVTPTQVLIVEDHDDSARSLSKLLDHHGYHTVIAATYRDAVQLARSQKFDIAVCDIGLPDGDGCELLAELQAMYPVKGMALTGYGMPDDIERCKRAGFGACVVKPCTIEDLLGAIQQVSQVHLDSDSAHGPSEAIL